MAREPVHECGGARRHSARIALDARRNRARRRAFDRWNCASETLDDAPLMRTSGSAPPTQLVDERGSSQWRALPLLDFCNTIVSNAEGAALMDKIIVYERIHERHPELEVRDVLHAWNQCFRSAPRLRKPGEYLAIGTDARGRLLEMAAVRLDDAWLVFHAMTTPSNKTISELGIKKGGAHGTHRTRRHRPH